MARSIAGSQVTVWRVKVDSTLSTILNGLFLGQLIRVEVFRTRLAYCLNVAKGGYVFGSDGLSVCLFDS